MPKHGAHLFARNLRGLFHKLLVFDWLLAFATQLSDISWSAGVLKLLSKQFPLLSFQHSFQVLAARAARGRSFMILNSCIQDRPKQYKRTSFVRLQELSIVNSWRPRQPSSVNEAGFRNLDIPLGFSYIQTLLTPHYDIYYDAMYSLVANCLRVHSRINWRWAFGWFKMRTIARCKRHRQIAAPLRFLLKNPGFHGGKLSNPGFPCGFRGFPIFDYFTNSQLFPHVLLFCSFLNVR